MRDVIRRYQVVPNVVALFDQFIYSGTNFLTVVIVGRFASPEILGLYVLGYGVVLWFIGIQSSIVTIPYTTFYVRYDVDEQKNYNGSILVMHLSLAIFVVILSALGYLLPLDELMHQSSELFLILGFCIVSCLARDFIRRVEFVLVDFRYVICFDLSVAFLQIVFLVVLIHRQSIFVDTIFGAIGLASFIPCMIWFFLNKRRFRFSKKLVRSHCEQNFRFGKWIVSASAIYLFSSQLYLWVLTLFQRASVTGKYSAYINITYAANPIVLGLSNYWYPFISRTLINEGKEALKRRTIKMTCFMVSALSPIYLMLICFSDTILGALYGSEYTGNESVVILLSISAVIYISQALVIHGLNAMNRPDLELKGNLIYLGVSFFGGILLVRTYGIVGAAISYLAGVLLVSLYKLYYFLIAEYDV